MSRIGRKHAILSQIRQRVGEWRLKWEAAIFSDGCDAFELYSYFRVNLWLDIHSS